MVVSFSVGVMWALTPRHEGDSNRAGFIPAHDQRPGHFAVFGCVIAANSWNSWSFKLETPSSRDCRSAAHLYRKAAIVKMAALQVCRGSEGGRISCPVEMFRQY